MNYDKQQKILDWIFVFILFVVVISFVFSGTYCASKMHYEKTPIEKKENSKVVIEERPSWVIPENVPDQVVVTIYHPDPKQTDDTPNILADGTKIDIHKAGRYRYCALSRDLLERWGGNYAYGDTLILDGAGHFSGKWVVKDTMHPRWENRIDLLVDLGTRPYKFEVATIRKVL